MIKQIKQRMLGKMWLVILVCAVYVNLLLAEGTVEFRQTVPLAPTDRITLDVSVPQGSLTISYSRAGEISVAASARALDGEQLPADYLSSSLTVGREGSHVKVRFTPNDKYTPRKSRISYTIGVPYLLEVNSSVENGKQAIDGVMGPVKLVTGSGDIKATNITRDFEATTGTGNIEVTRVGFAAKVETGSGNISLHAVGPATAARVAKGTGSILVDGISGSLTATTDTGELVVKGDVYDSWALNSTSGNIRIEIPTESKYDLDAATQSGQLSVENVDIPTKDANPRECHQKVNGGGKLLRARTGSGSIFIQGFDQ